MMTPEDIAQRLLKELHARGYELDEASRRLVEDAIKAASRITNLKR